MKFSKSDLLRRALLVSLFVFLLAAQIQALPTDLPVASRATLDQGPAEIADLLGLAPAYHKLLTVQSQRTCGSPATLEELTVRQDLLEAIETTSLDVDSVLAELSNERGKLSDLRYVLQSRRDRSVAKLNTAALITGAGVSAGVSATQITTLGSKTQNTGDAIGIGAGAASTILSLMAVRQQRGPETHVGRTSNMLAPLFDRTPVLNTYYPPEVMGYLESLPPGEDRSRGTRLEQLKSEWVRAGRLDSTDDPKRRSKVAALTASEDANVKVSIDDLADRIAMLNDVTGHVSLMKRDLASLMRSYIRSPQACKAQGEPQP